MTNTSADRRQLWHPPPRPDWVRLLNEEGDCMDIRGVVPLDVDSLLESARQSTGLSDFGVDDWCEPFRVLVRSLEEEAALNLVGRLKIRSDLLLYLEARLRIEDTYKRHPEIEDEEIHKPLIVVGQGRSGTSFLLNVLAADPGNGAITHWEYIFPCPPPEKASYRTDPRIERAEKLIGQWNRITPTMPTVHEYGATVPAECDQMLGMTFVSPMWFSYFAQVPGYSAFIAGLDPIMRFRYHRRVLKLLQWKNPRRHWVLKSVPHLDYMPELLEVYPDACFIWPHRDPIRALASAVNTVGIAQWAHSDFPLKDTSFDAVLDPQTTSARLERAIDRLESGVVPKAQMFNVLYRDFVAEPMKTVESIYRYHGIPFTAEGRTGIAVYLHENPRESRPPHKVQKGSDDMVARDREIFRHYMEYFGVPEE